MKTFRSVLSITLFVLIGISSSSAMAELTKEQKACRDFVLTPSHDISLATSSFLARNGDAYRPVTKEDYQSLLFGLCIENLSAAESASSLDNLDLYLFSARSHWIGTLGYPVVLAEDIARNYYRSLHNMQSKKEVAYPSLPANPTQDDRVAALDKYASQKLLRGMSIKDHCESIAKKMPNNSLPSEDLKRTAVQVCEGVMAMNFTKGKHGISSKTAMNIAEKEYGKNSDEYHYLDHVTNLAFSESQ